MDHVFPPGFRPKRWVALLWVVVEIAHRVRLLRAGLLCHSERFLAVGALALPKSGLLRPLRDRYHVNLPRTQKVQVATYQCNHDAEAFNITSVAHQDKHVHLYNSNHRLNPNLRTRKKK